MLHRLIGDQATTIRVYAMRQPDFNAAMAPNGMMIVNSGFLARVRNEAQLAAALGHECGHYLRCHALQKLTKQHVMSASAIMAILAAAAVPLSGHTGASWYDVANAINNGLLLSDLLLQSRARNRSRRLRAAVAGQCRLPADFGSAGLVSADPGQPEGERCGSQEKIPGRRRILRDPPDPPSVERMRDLAETGQQFVRIKGEDAHYDDRRTDIPAATGPIRQMLLEEQIKLNDPGASLYLLNSLGAGRLRTAVLRYYEAEAYRLRDEPGDHERADASYKLATQSPGCNARGILWRRRLFADQLGTAVVRPVAPLWDVTWSCVRTQKTPRWFVSRWVK